MKLIIKEKMMSLFGQFNVYNEADEVLYYVVNKSSLLHRFSVFDAEDHLLAEMKGDMMAMLPEFRVTLGNTVTGKIKQKPSVARSQYFYEDKGWHAEGDFRRWDFALLDESGTQAVTVSGTTPCIIDIQNEDDILPALLMIMAIDAFQKDEGATLTLNI